MGFWNKSKEVAVTEPPMPHIDTDELRKGMDFGIHSSFDNKNVHRLSEEGQVRYYGTPRDIQEHRQYRLGYDGKETVVGYVSAVEPSDGMSKIQHLPAYSMATIIGSQEDPKKRLSIHDNYTGRIADWPTLVVGEGKDFMGRPVAGQGRMITHSAHDSLYTAGHVWMDSEAAKSADHPKGAKEYNVLAGRDGKGLAHMTAVFLRDAGAQYPLAGYPHLRDWRMVSVVSSACVNPTDGFVDGFELNDEGQHERIWGPLGFMLSDEFQAYRNSIGGSEEYFMKTMSDTIAGFGKVFNRLYKYASAGKQMDWDQDVWYPVLKEMEKENPAAHDQMVRYANNVNGDMYDMRMPARAAYELAAISRFLKNNPNTSDASRARAARHRNNVYKEFIEGTTMAMQRLTLENMAKYDNGASNPIRAEWSGVDEFDQTWAMALSFVTRGDAATVQKAQQVAQLYGSEDAEGLRFIMNATGGNQLLYYKENMHNMELSQFKQGGMAYKTGMTMKHDSRGGAFPGEMVRSFYNPALQNHMPGIIGRFVIRGPGMKTAAVEGFALDVRLAPAAVAQKIVLDMKMLEKSNNNFSTDSDDIRKFPTFGQIFSDLELLPPVREVIITKSSVNKETGIHEVKPVGTVSNGEVILLMRDGDKKDVTLLDGSDGLALSERSEAFKRQQQQLPKDKQMDRKSAIHEIARLRNTYKVINTKPPKVEPKKDGDDDEEEIKPPVTVGGIVMANHVPHFFATRRTPEYKTIVMPSEKRQGVRPALASNPKSKTANSAA